MEIQNGNCLLCQIHLLSDQSWSVSSEYLWDDVGVLLGWELWSAFSKNHLYYIWWAVHGEFWCPVSSCFMLGYKQSLKTLYRKAMPWGLPAWKWASRWGHGSFEEEEDGVPGRHTEKCWNWTCSLDWEGWIKCLREVRVSEKVRLKVTRGWSQELCKRGGAWGGLVSLQDSAVLKVAIKCYSGSQPLYVFCIIGL